MKKRIKCIHFGSFLETNLLNCRNASFLILPLGKRKSNKSKMLTDQQRAECDSFFELLQIFVEIETEEDNNEDSE